MLDSKIGRSRTTLAEQEESEESDEIAVSPIGILVITDPGAITAAMLLSSQRPRFYSYFTLIFSIFFVLSLVYIILRNGELILELLGTAEISIIQRLMGLILMVIEVQFVNNGGISVYNSQIVQYAMDSMLFLSRHN